MSSTKHKRPAAACGDCGIDTLQSGHDFYMVHDHLWRMAWPTAAAKIAEPLGEILAYAPDAGGQYDFGFERCAEPLREILCIRCLELRLGRALTAADFTDAPVNDTRRWRVLYGELDEFAVAPFVKYGEPLSNEGRASRRY
jgi:hypothetical protein